MNPPFRTLGLLLAVLAALSISISSSNLAPAESLEGPRRVEYLLNNLERASDYKVRIAAATELGRIADGTLGDWMIRALRRESNDAVRLSTLYAVGQIPDARIIPPLLELAHQELLSDLERLAVERILWNVRKAFVLEAWTSAVTSAQDATERALFTWLVGVVGDTPVLPVLAKAATDSAPFVRRRAVQAVGAVGSQSGRPICLRVQRSDPEPTVREASKTCIVRLDLLKTGHLPRDKTHRLPLHGDFADLQVRSVTPDTFRLYLRKNVNPRAVDQAVASLRTNEAEIRQDKSIRLIDSERILKTIRVNFTMLTGYTFSPGELSRLREVVREEAGYVNQCYLAALKTNRKLGGQVTVKFRVLQAGSVSGAAVESATLPDPVAQGCIVQKVQAIQFPRIPLSFIDMRYTFTFTPPKDEKYEFTAR